MTIYDPRNSSDSQSRRQAGGADQNGWYEMQQGLVIDEEVAAEVRQIRNFQIGLYQQTPRVFLTPAFIGINVIMFVIMVVSGVSISSPRVIPLLQWGANHGLLTLNGDWWRLLTCTIIHIGIFHLLINLYALWILGPAVERLFQPAGFFVIYLLAGLGGSLASVWWQPMVTSAGASGAIFGVFGALMGFAVRQRQTLPRSVFVQLRNNGLLVLGINLALGFGVKGIDMAGHLGGLGVGFVLGALLAMPVGPELRMQRNIRSLFAGGVGIMLMVGVYVFMPRAAVNNPLELMRMRQLLSTKWTPKTTRAVQRFQRSLRAFVADEKRITEAYKDAHLKVLTRQLTKEAFLRKMETEVIPAWKKISRHFATIIPADLPPSLRERYDLLMRYIRAKQESWELLVQSLRTDDPKIQAKAQAKQQEMSKILKKLNNK